ncbi:hypothetical protein CR513_42784, partial [Mucuna pruriens]
MGRWVEELPQVLWSFHTTPHSTTQETPFRLTSKQTQFATRRKEDRSCKGGRIQSKDDQTIKFKGSSKTTLATSLHPIRRTPTKSWRKQANELFDWST